MDNRSDLNLDTLKQAWHSQQFAAPEPAPPSSARMHSFSAKLARRFGRTAIIGFVMAVAIWGLNAALELPLWLVTAMSAFFAIMGALQGSMWMKFSDVDFGRMTAQQAVMWVVGIRKGMARRMAAGITMAIPILVLMLRNFLAQDEMLFISGWIGLIIGAGIGYAKWLQNIRCIRQMERELEPFADSARS